MSIITEEWRDIKGYEGYYQVSSLGRVRSCDRYVLGRYNNTLFKKGTSLKPWINEKGYYCLTLAKDSRKKHFKLHRLVALAFVDGYFEGSQVNHIDGIKRNNNSTNLEFCDGRHNMLHSYKIGLRKDQTGVLAGSKHPKAKLKDSDILTIRERAYSGEKRSKLAKEYAVCIGVIDSVVTRRSWKHIP